MKKYFLLICLVLPAGHTFSQSTSISTFFHKNVTKADILFDRSAYRNALEIYLQQLNHDTADYHVRERIATCYLKLQDPASAERWYRSLATGSGIHTESKFAYAEVLSRIGNYDASLRWFKEYLKDRPADQVALDKVDFLNNLVKYTGNEQRFLISPFDFSTDRSEFGAHFFHNGVVFASSQDMDLFIKRKPFDGLTDDESFLNLYYAEKNELGDWDKFVPFYPKKLKTFYQEGPMAFYDHYRKGAFTRSNLKKGRPVYDANGKVNLGIYFADVDRLGGSGPVTPFKYNSDAYSNAHPSFSADGKVMYFSSTAPTGHGNSDLYYSIFLNERWTEPINLGDAINTPGDESFPHIANDTTLYFASNGHGGLGGLDIYVSYKRDDKFGKPINPGIPMNSRFDDFSLVCDSLGREGFISANSDEDKGHDHIFRYTAKFYFLAGEVRELNRSHQKIPGVRIFAYNGNGDLIDSARSDQEGNFTLDLPFDQDFRIRGEKDGFETLNDVAFSTRGKPFGIDSLMLPMWRQNLFARGRIFSNETQSVLAGVSVIRHDLTDGLTDTLVVNERGEYQFLVRPDKDYRIEGTKDGFVPNGFNLDTKDMEEGDLLNDILLEEIYIDKEVILFDFDKHEILEGSAQLIDKLIRTLKKYPKAILNIGAHSDSRGSHEYNMGLSKRRAHSTRDYLISGGIRTSRIHLTWFGEELILNRCSDGVDCPEEEHSKNRRAELKVQKEPVN